MGCCLSRDGSLTDSEELDGQLAIGKSRPLLQERLKWKSDVPITEGQLRSKRDEFWETAPCFEGRKEIWDALRAASTQAENGDWAMAQAILEGANVVLPDGTLRESYDELGNRYQVPIYCLFHPINIIERNSESSINSQNQNGNNANGPDFIDLHPPPGGQLITLKIRISSKEHDHKIDAKTTETVSSVKRRLAALHDLPQDLSDQRWYHGGRYLSDKLTIQECRIPDNFVVQVIIRSKEDLPIVSTEGGKKSSSKKHSSSGQSNQKTSGTRKKKHRRKESAIDKSSKGESTNAGNDTLTGNNNLTDTVIGLETIEPITVVENDNQESHERLCNASENGSTRIELQTTNYNDGQDVPGQILSVQEEIEAASPKNRQNPSLSPNKSINEKTGISHGNFEESSVTLPSQIADEETIPMKETRSIAKSSEESKKEDSRIPKDNKKKTKSGKSRNKSSKTDASSTFHSISSVTASSSVQSSSAASAPTPIE